MTAATAATIEEAPAATASTSSDLSVRGRWRRYRILVGVAAFGVVAAIVVAVLSSGANNGDLDPRSFRPNGTHALAALLAQRGVSVETETSVASAVSQAGAHTTLVVSHPERLDDVALSRVAATAGDLVVLEAGPLELGGLNLGVVPGGDASDSPTASVTPACSLAAATAAGPVTTGYYSYRVPDGGVGCYPLVDGYALVTFEQDGRHVTLVGDAMRIDASDALRRRYLRYRPEAEQYLSLGDFLFVALEPVRCRYIGGFAQMGWLEATEWKDAAILPLEEEETLLSRFGNAGILGIDYYGVDLLRDGKRKRMQFATACRTPDDIAAALRGLPA